MREVSSTTGRELITHFGFEPLRVNAKQNQVSETFVVALRRVNELAKRRAV